MGFLRDDYSSIVLPNLVEPFKLHIDLLHHFGATAFVGVVLQCQSAVFLLEFRQ
jgi:hypothetical protein